MGATLALSRRLEVRSERPTEQVEQCRERPSCLECNRGGGCDL